MNERRGYKRYLDDESESNIPRQTLRSRYVAKETDATEDEVFYIFYIS